MRRWETYLQLFIIAAGLVGPVVFLLRDPPAVKYCIFMLMSLVWIFRTRLSQWQETVKLPGGVFTNLFLLVLGIGLAQEYFFWLHENLAGNLIGNKAHHLFNPRLLIDMLAALAYYLGMALALIILARWFRLPILPMFVIGALLGLFRESYHLNMERLVKEAFQDPKLTWDLFKTVLMAFAAHAPALVIPLLLTEEKVPGNRMKPVFLEYPLILLTLWLGANTFYYLMMRGLQAVGLVVLRNTSTL